MWARGAIASPLFNRNKIFKSAPIIYIDITTDYNQITKKSLNQSPQVNVCKNVKERKQNVCHNETTGETRGSKNKLSVH